ncbi:MAG: aldo/keto reductase [Clostridia bacterium]|nr:aldo/keto reductase [Clostridia bacterium]
MQWVTLGSTGLRVSRNGFGALPIQRVDRAAAVRLLRKAFDHGITYFDTARSYTDSEEKIGAAFTPAMRERIVISTKTMSRDAAGFWADLHESLRLMGTDYVDIYQFHTPPFCPKPGDGSGLYEAALEARRQGKIRHIGLTNHRLSVAREAIESGLYATLQYPFSYLATEAEEALVSLCGERDMGFIAMKGLAGGLITHAAAAYAFMAQYGHVAPIWGVQHEWELDQFLACQDAPPALDGALRAVIEKDRAELMGDFCRGCGYCMPCPEEITINQCARMSLMLRRAPSEAWLSETWQAEMRKIERCRQCGQCRKQCPYGLDTPALLKKNLEDYRRRLK